jgi:hypothetical protein
MRNRIALLAAASLIAGCAPDAWQNVRAQQFNAFLDTLAARCQPLWIGSTLYTTIEPSVGPAGQYDQLLDLLSRLFYQRISPADFRAAMRDSWSDGQTAASTECIIAQLPAARPTAPGGR